MNDSSQENTASRKSLAEHPSDSSAEAEKRRQYVAANRDRIREMNRLWRAEHLERARQINRDSERRAAARRHREAEVRARGRERAKRWREVHPDRRREYQQQWMEENRAKVREYYNRYYEAHRDEVNARAAVRRDADPDRTKQISKEWADRNKERRAELQRIRRSDPETYQSELEVNAAARRLKRSLSRAGLPPKRLHPTTAAERRVDEREADAYFHDQSRPEHLRQFTVFAESLTEHMLKNGARMHEFAEAYVENRARMGLPQLPVENIVYARAVELVVERMHRVDLLTSRDVAAAVRSTKTEVRRAERQQQFDRLVKTVVAQVQRNSARYAVDAEVENRARTHHGKPRVSVESLVVQRAMEEVIERMPTSSLTIEDGRSATRAAKIRIAASRQALPDTAHDRIRRRAVG
ncbi:hypothetical protein E3O06_11790 [Cryobacterium glaciale]|uniref:Uncharacterized protein n=1 Tax=Cryobacterium glaciale TaxID=1259145 RepID=A0A4R8UVF3_9MICO|nr:hypothetical protein [Cryobacterium glaciale]TFB71521.1 hypothetical protein E3O06_11790 [Cryobacterium glaciale]